MANLRICPINFFDQASLVDTPAMLASLPVTNAQLTARDAVTRSTTIFDQQIKGTFNGQWRKADSFFLFRHTGQGGRVRLQLHKYADYTTDVYDSGVVDIYTLQGLDVDFGWSPLGYGSNDLLAAEAPYSLFFTAATFASFTITFSRCQREYWQFGRIFLGKYIEAPYNPEHGMAFGWQTTGKQQRSHGASLRTQPGERYRELRADMFYESDSDRAIWRDMLGQIDVSEDVAISVFPGAGGRQERDYVANMQLSQHSPFNWASPVFKETIITFTEV